MDKDTGAHYRNFYRGIQLDPFRLARVLNLDAAQFTVLKKITRGGDGGYKSSKQDWLDVIGAAERAIEMIDEDEENIPEH